MYAPECSLNFLERSRDMPLFIQDTQHQYRRIQSEVHTSANSCTEVSMLMQQKPSKIQQF